MTYLQTEYFLHVAQTKSITRTSADLYVSPPAISKQISLLEEELGVSLFIRGAKGMELTKAGEIMYNHFQNQKTAFESAIHHARGVESEISNELHLGMLSKWDLWPQMFKLRDYLKNSPSKTTLLLHSCFNPGGTSVLNRGELDATICLANDILIYAGTHDLEFTEITKIPKVFLFSKSSPLSRKKKLKPEDFKDFPLLVISSAAAVAAHQNNMTLCHNLGLQPDIIFKDSLEDALLGVGLDEGFFICDTWLNPVLLPGFRYILVPDTHAVVLAWWKYNKNPGLPALIECCKNIIQWPVTL